MWASENARVILESRSNRWNHFDSCKNSYGEGRQKIFPVPCVPKGPLRLYGTVMLFQAHDFLARRVNEHDILLRTASKNHLYQTCTSIIPGQTLGRKFSSIASTNWLQRWSFTVLHGRLPGFPPDTAANPAATFTRLLYNHYLRLTWRPRITLTVSQVNPRKYFNKDHHLLIRRIFRCQPREKYYIIFFILLRLFYCTSAMFAVKFPFIIDWFT